MKAIRTRALVTTILLLLLAGCSSAPVIPVPPKERIHAKDGTAKRSIIFFRRK